MKISSIRVNYALLVFFIFFAIVILFTQQILFKKMAVKESNLIGQQIPKLELTSIFAGESFSEKDLLGQVSLLNVWASWCDTCRLEQPILMLIKDVYHIPIYGIVYKDTSSRAKEWLKKNGNPFVKVGLDPAGEAAIDLGIYGTPETFVIDAQGIIVYKHVGMIDEGVWENFLYPLIQQYKT